MEYSRPSCVDEHPVSVDKISGENYLCENCPRTYTKKGDGGKNRGRPNEITGFPVFVEIKNLQKWTLNHCRKKEME